MAFHGDVSGVVARLIKAYLTDSSGVAAIEFAFCIGFSCMALILAIQTGWLFWVINTWQNGVLQ